ITDRGYRFLGTNADGTRLVPIESDELLGPRNLPLSMALAPLKPRKEPSDRPDLVLFDPSGEFPAFTFVFTIGQLKWYVQGQNDGQIVSAPTVAPATAGSRRAD